LPAARATTTAPLGADALRSTAALRAGAALGTAALVHAAPGALPGTSPPRSSAAGPTAARAAPATLAGTTPARARGPAAPGLADVFEYFGIQPGPGAFGAGQAALGAFGDVEVGEQVLGGGIGLHRFTLAQPDRAVDESPAGEVIPVHERDRGAARPGAGGPPDPVQVGLLVLGALVVDDVRDVVDVDPAGGDVGGDEHVHLSAAERAQGLLASTLAEIPVQGSGSEPAIDEILGHAGGGALCAHEDDRQTPAAGLQHAGDEFHFVQRVGPVGELGHGFDRGGVVGGIRGADVGGAGHVAARHRDDGAGHRRGEQHRVSVRGGGGQQRFDVGKEPEVEHLVGLVEHDGPHRAEVQVALVEQVDHPARGAHDHFHAPFQGFDLWFVGAPAVHLQDPQAPALRGRLQVTGDLDREFAGGHDDERLRLAGVLQVLPAVLARSDDPLEHGDAEPEGLARAGLRLADDVVARE